MELNLLHDPQQIDQLRGRARPKRAGDATSAETSRGDAAGGDDAADRAVRITVLCGVGLVLAAEALDATIISVALPAIRNDLGGGAQFIQWVASVYFLTCAIVLVPAGRLTDLIGARRVFVVGGTVYVVGAILGAAAFDPVLLVVGRSVQGAGSGIASPAALVLLTQVFGSRRRGNAIGLVSTVLAAASALGPLIGGVLTDAVSWRVIFVNHAVMAGLGTVLTFRAAHRVPTGKRTSIDGRGAAAWAGVILSFQLAVLHWHALGGVAGPALLGTSLAIGWLLVRTERRRDEPMLDLALLRIPAVAASTIARVVVCFAFFGNIYYLTLFLQSVDGFSAFQTGLILLPSSVVGVVASPFVGRAIDRVGSGVVLALGTAATALALFVLAVVHETSSVTTRIAPALVLNGLGFAMVSVSAKSAPLGAVRADLQGRVTSLVSVISKAASGFGVTAATGFFNLYSPPGIDKAVADYKVSGSDTMRSFIRDHLGSSDLHRQLTPHNVAAAGFSDVKQAIDVIRDSFAFSMSLMMATVGLLVLAGAGAVALLMRHSLGETPHDGDGT